MMNKEQYRSRMENGHMLKLYDYPIEEAEDADVAVRLAKMDAKGALYDIISAGEAIISPPASKENSGLVAFSDFFNARKEGRPVVLPYLDHHTTEIEKRDIQVVMSKEEWESDNAFQDATAKALSTRLEDGWKVARVLHWGDIAKTHLRGKSVTVRADKNELETRYFVITPGDPLPDWNEGFLTEDEAVKTATERVEQSVCREGREVVSIQRTKDGQAPVQVKYEVDQYLLTAEVLVYRSTSDEDPSPAGHIVALRVVDSEEYATRGINA